MDTSNQDEGDELGIRLSEWPLVAEVEAFEVGGI